eukprot:4083973-Lingulodinium_polyedra.AAC.1
MFPTPHFPPHQTRTAPGIDFAVATLLGLSQCDRFGVPFGQVTVVIDFYLANATAFVVVPIHNR